MRAIAPPGRRRVLVIGAHLHAHSVTRVTAGLLAGLAAGGHEVHVLHLSRREDAVTRRIVEGATSCRAGSLAPAAMIAHALAVAADVVVYPELGQDPATMWCAATRLAPVQMALWGHPLTSGLPTIDYFVAPAAMERVDADADYTEVLHRLPGLGGQFDPPGAAPHPLWHLPMRERHPRKVQLLVAQHGLKLTPAHDALYARILAAAPETVLTVLVHPVGHAELAARMRPALVAAGVDPGRVDVLPPLEPDRFAAAARQCDLNLDTIGWSGGVSTLDLTHHGLPTLTCPQRSLRSRQSMAMMQALGLDELVAEDADDWAARAIALARDPDRLAGLRREILARRNRVFGVPDAVTAFADLVARVMPR
jgi:predicted O-linked N-acetylglucosamine transferase (SPINDLY family)